MRTRALRLPAGRQGISEAAAPASPSRSFGGARPAEMHNAEFLDVEYRMSMG